MQRQKRSQVQAMSKRSPNSSSPPPWEVLALLAHHLDPKSLGLASCVSKLWYMCMASDHIWKPFCMSHYPSLSNLKITHPFVSYHRLYAMAYVAAKLRARGPSEPQFSIDSLIFDIHILGTKDNHPIVKIAKPGNEFCYDHNGLFRFDFGANNYECLSSVNKMLEGVKITWNVVLKDWSAAFTMMDYEGKVRYSPGSKGWFSQELPRPRCCSSDSTSGIVADLKLEFYSEKDCGDKVRVDKIVPLLLGRNTEILTSVSTDDCYAVIVHLRWGFKISSNNQEQTWMLPLLSARYSIPSGFNLDEFLGEWPN
ncbi:hypothetical protein SADUNF_Sadunf06G0030200 [Salix dunnii]|uniref:F-box protein n=1 Tax=Salix dunnii TaxID=1413687 RepID=A0A835K562_9ROSI|nr:hypothetical protein SADUNF_Sadunf06G0030200 [Salix dunnii]